MRKRWWRGLSCLVLLALLAGLAGCLDYDLELALRKNGSGSLSTVIRLPVVLADRAAPRGPEVLVWPPVRLTTGMKDGWLTVRRTSRFRYLDEVGAWRVRFKLEQKASGVLGLTAYTYRITGWVFPAEGDLPDRLVLPGTEEEVRTPPPPPADPARRQARRLVAQALAGRHFTVRYRVEGEVVSARPVVLGSSRVDPVIGPRRRQVAWHIPLAVLINEDLRHTLILVAEFKSKLEFRAPGQTEIASHAPTAQERASARRNRKGDRP